MRHEDVVGLGLFGIVDDGAVGTAHGVYLEFIAVIVDLQTGVFDARDDHLLAVAV